MAKVADREQENISAKVRGLITMLIIQFFAGMALNVIGVAEAEDSTIKKIASFSVGIVHIATAIGLLVVSAILLWKSLKLSNTYIKMKLRYGFSDILIAFVFGILTASVKSLEELFSFLMAASFMLALITYGSLYMKLNSKKY